jgi:hypothetical protein
MRHIILFSIAAVVLTGAAAWIVTSIQSPKSPPVLSQFDPFSLEEKAKNLPTQEWLDRNMWPNNVD